MGNRMSKVIKLRKHAAHEAAGGQSRENVQEHRRGDGWKGS